MHLKADADAALQHGAAAFRKALIVVRIHEYGLQMFGCKPFSAYFCIGLKVGPDASITNKQQLMKRILLPVAVALAALAAQAQPQDGFQTFACGITADGKKVVGYVSTGNMASTWACQWVEADGGQWNMELLPVPEGITTSQARYVSTDGSTVVGTATDANWASIVLVWEDGVCRQLTAAELGLQGGSASQVSLAAVSHSARYLLLNVGYTSYIIYDMAEGTSRSMATFGDNATLSGLAIDDSGNVVGTVPFGSVFFGGDIYYRPFWYSYQEGRILDLSYCMGLFAPGTEPPFSMAFDDKTQAQTAAVSADGRLIVGNVNANVMLGEKPQCWMLGISIDAKGIPATPTGLAGRSDALHEVELTWLKDEAQYDGFSLKSYNIYRDGELTATLPATAEEMKIRQTGVPCGHPSYVVEAVYERDGSGQLLSPRSNALAIAVPDSYSLPLFEGFESGSLLTNYWEVVPESGDKADLNWNPLQYAGIPGNALLTNTSSRLPYSVSLVSRPLDATQMASVKLSFAIIVGYLNVADQPLDRDSLSVDVSVDEGTTWKEVKGWSMADLDATKNWSLRTVDLSEAAAGKLFKLRLRKHGQGAAMYYHQIDNLSVGAGSERTAPSGLTGSMAEGGKSVSLAWRNASGAYQLNHVKNLALNIFTIGNEGKEVIAANSFGPGELALYAGKYLSGVRTMLNKYDYGTDVKGIHADIVVFEDGKLVRQQEIAEPVFNADFTVALDEPLPIDASKELKIGIRVHDYDETQMPVTYIMSADFLPGKSDLYSEDGGATWLRLSDFYAGQGMPEQGLCCWNITGCVTDAPGMASAEAEEPYAYNVLRNGVQVNSLMLDKLQTRFTDPEGSQADCYEVVAYYLDGTESAPSDAFCVSSADGIDGFIADGVSVKYAPGDSRIAITGRYDSAQLTAMSGIVVARAAGGSVPLGGVRPGVYLLQVEVGGRVAVQKVAIME